MGRMKASRSEALAVAEHAAASRRAGRIRLGPVSELVMFHCVLVTQQASCVRVSPGPSPGRLPGCWHGVQRFSGRSRDEGFANQADLHQKESPVESRRRFLQKAAYAAPVILTVAIRPALACHGYNARQGKPAGRPVRGLRPGFPLFRFRTRR